MPELEAPQVITTPPAASGTLGRRAARLSWILSLTACVSGPVKAVLGPAPGEGLVMLVILCGLIAAVVAFTRIPKEGRDGILIPALIGALLNAAVITIFVTNFLAYRARHL